MSNLGITSGTPAYEIYQKLLDQNQNVPGFSLSDVLEEGGGLRILFEYLQDINHPALLPPKEGGEEGPPQSLENPPSFEQALMDALNQALYELLEANPKLTETDLDQILNHVLLGSPLDPKLQSVMDQLDESVIENMAEGWELTDDQQKNIRDGKYRDLLPTFAASYNNDVEKDINSAIDNETKKILDQYETYLKEQGYSDDEIAEMKKGLETKLYLIRSGYTNFSEEELASIPGFQGKNVSDLWDDIKQSALNTVSNLWSLEPGDINTIFTGLEYTNFIAKTTIEKDNLVENMIREYGIENDLTEQEIKLMIYLYYNPDTAFLGDGDVENFPGIAQERFNELLNVVNGFETASLSKLGLPEGFKLEPGSELFNTRIDAEFQRLFYQNLKNQKPSLTDQQIKEIITALKDPDWATKASPELVAIINKVIEQTSTQLVNELGIPATWGPSTTILQGMGDIGRTTLFAWGIVDQLEDFLEIYSVMLKDMPDGPKKATILNILKIISKFLNDLKNAIVVMQMNDSELSAKFSQLQVDMLRIKLAEQEKVQKEIEEQQAKIDDWTGWLPEFTKSEWFKNLMIAVTVIMAALTFGALAGLVVLVLIVWTLVAEDKNWKNSPEQLINEIGDGTADLINSIEGVDMPEDTLKIVSMIIQTMFIVGLTAMAGGSPLFAAEMFFTYSGVVQESVLMANPDINPIYPEIINMVAQFAVELPAMAAEMVMSGGASVGAEMAKTMAKVYKFLGKMLAKIARWLAKLADQMAEKFPKLSKVLLRVAEFLTDKSDDYFEKARKTEKFVKQVEKMIEKSEMDDWDHLDDIEDVADDVADVADVADDVATTSTKLARKKGDIVDLDDLGDVEDVATATSKIARKKGDKVDLDDLDVVDDLEVGVESAEEMISKPGRLGVRTSNLKEFKEFKKFLKTDDFYKTLYNRIRFKRLKKIATRGTIVATGVKAEEAAVQAVIYNIKAEMALLEGEMGAMDEEVKALVAIIKKLIVKLLELISGMGEWMQDVGKQQNSLWRDRSQILSQVFGQA